MFRSAKPDVSVPDVPLTEFVFRDVGARADEPALIDGPSDRTYTFGALYTAVRKAAKGLSERGFGKGDVLALYSPNVPEYAVAFFGAAALGGVNTTVNPLYTVEELTRQLTDANARFIVTVPAFVDKAREAANAADVEEVFVFGQADGATPFAELLDNDGDPPTVEIDPASDLVALPYSSGTTGMQKGVMLTHRNIVANLRQAVAAMEGGVKEGDVVIGVLPFFHIYGMVVVMALALVVGASVVTMPRFDLEEFLGLLQKHRVTVAYLVPPIVLALAHHPAVSNYDLSSLRWIMSAAAPLGKDIAQVCAERLDCLVFQGYGLTETSPVSHCCPVHDDKVVPGSVGPCVPNTECKIVDPSTGAELGVGQEGEIWTRGPQVMKGYLGRPEATAACIDSDGFFHTGDIGYVDENGYFFIVDRLKELIKYKGFQVAPAELEALLLSHPAIRDAAVVPFPDDEAGEIPKAFVVVSEPISGEAIQDFVAEHVSPHKKVRAIELIAQIPKSPSGKILRRVLVDRDRKSSS